MKRRILVGILLIASVVGASVSAQEEESQRGRLRVCGQNMRNYYINYDNYNSSRANYDHAAFAQKTARIVDAFLEIDADIYAMCEVEACELVLTQLADSLNKYAGEVRYAAAKDGINVKWDSYDNNIKSGFLYRVDKVKPYRNNTQASSWNYYKNTMRIQAFEELATGERFVLSMNHFKAKTGSGGEQTRKDNANHLLNALKKSLGDPDILIMGDLNCELGEEPLNMLENAGYMEQLVRFDEEAYTHCYSGGELIDHVFANESMSTQIVGAQIFHICTTWCGDYDNYSTTYSDHDPYAVELNLGDHEGIETVTGDGLQVTGQKILLDGRIYILIGEDLYDILGQKVQ